MFIYTRHRTRSFRWLCWVWLLALLFLVAWAGSREIQRREGHALLPVEEQTITLARQLVMANRDAPPGKMSEDFLRLFPHRTDGLIAPLYPWMLESALLAQSDSPGEIAGNGRWFNLGLGMMALALGSGYLLSRGQPALASAVAVIFGGLLVPFMGRCSAEMISMIFFSLAWLCARRLSQDNPPWRYTYFGVLLALTLLSGEGALPLALAFFLYSTVRFVRQSLPRLLTATFAPVPQRWSAANHLVGMSFLIMAFLLPNIPRMMHSFNEFGTPLYMHSRGTRWLDTPGQARAWVNAHPDRASLAAVDPLARPSAQKYFQSHTVAQMLNRLHDGLGGTLQSMMMAQPVPGHEGPVPPPLRPPLLFSLGILTAGMLVLSITYKRLMRQGESNGAILTSFYFTALALVCCLTVLSWDRASHLFPSPPVALLGGLALQILFSGETCRCLLLSVGTDRANKAALTYKIMLWVIVLVNAGLLF